MRQNAIVFADVVLFSLVRKRGAINLHSRPLRARNETTRAESDETIKTNVNKNTTTEPVVRHMSKEQGGNANNNSNKQYSKPGRS